MTMLDVLSLVVACVAIAFGVVAAVRARTAGEVAAAARHVAERAEETASAARADAAAADERAREARSDAASALDQATRALADAARARESAVQAQESAVAAVRALEAGGRRDPQQLNGDRVAPGGSAVDPAVRWTLEHTKGAVWLMRNVGDATARSALLSDATQPPKYIRADEVIPRVVSPGDHLQFRVTAPRGGPPPRVRVTWREDDSDDPKSKDVTLLLEA